MPTRILIAEDALAVRTALRSLLESAGAWEIIEVQNGQEAVAKAQEFKPDLIILDLVMPVMDGLTAARQISKLLPEIPLLMHTMHWSPQVELEAQKVGVRRVVPKTNSTLLVSSVQEFLSPAQSPPIAPTAINPSTISASGMNGAAVNGSRINTTNPCTPDPGAVGHKPAQSDKSDGSGGTK